MKNPWTQIPRKWDPFVLPSERAVIRSFNADARENHKLRTEVLPEPYLGHPEAEIILLNLNPGFSKDDVPFYEDQYAARCWAKNLFHEPLEYPFYLLDPHVPQDVGGSRWWQRKLAALIKRAGLKTVANKVCCVEYFPYASKNYKPLGVTLESQYYSFYLVRRAVKRGALVVVMRAKKPWFEAVPELARHERVFELNSSQNVAISPGNCPDGFSEIERILTG